MFTYVGYQLVLVLPVTRFVVSLKPKPLGILAIGTFLNPPKSSSALLETCPYLQNEPCMFVDLSYSALMACTGTSCHLPGSNFAPFEKVKLKVPVSNSVEFSPKSAPWTWRILEILEDFGWLGLTSF